MMVMTLAGCDNITSKCSDEQLTATVAATVREASILTTRTLLDQNAGDYRFERQQIADLIEQASMLPDEIMEIQDGEKCRGVVALTFKADTLKSANHGRVLAGLDKITDFAASKSVGYDGSTIKIEVEYSSGFAADSNAGVQPSSAGLDVAGELMAAALVEPILAERKKQKALAEQNWEDALAAQKNAALQETRVAWTNSNAEINRAWQELTTSQRQSLLAQQRAWNQRKVAECGIEGLRTSNDPIEQQTAIWRCEARWNDDRINQLGYYDAY